MTGLDGRRVYLDWNATAPLRPEARAAMLEAMDTLGNPSSVHSEGRAAKAIVERSRAQVAALVNRDASEVVFTSGATEGANLAFPPGALRLATTDVEHDAVLGAVERARDRMTFFVIADAYEWGEIDYTALSLIGRGHLEDGQRVIVATAANSETGIELVADYVAQAMHKADATWVCDATQLVGKRALGIVSTSASVVFGSGHKIGGPTGIGFLAAVPSALITPQPGGGQEQGRRSGTENVVGIAGFGAAAVAAKRDLEAGVWDRVEKLRNILEEGLEAAAPDLIIFGSEASRLPNTSCFAVPGWKGETQVMQLDLAGFAVSAGSACSSGKVKESRVLRAMGFDSLTASSAIRVSLGPTTTEAEIRAFLAAWTELYRKRARRAA
ncbi:MAG: aminotransferase class V-fold PLP-dependent enzyme [Pseudomonadota bacterium]